MSNPATERATMKFTKVNAHQYEAEGVLIRRTHMRGMSPYWTVRVNGEKVACTVTLAEAKAAAEQAVTK